jgi:hypothetical protein
MSFRILLLAGALVAVAAVADAQAPLQLFISNGRVTLHVQNVPVRAILAEWSKVGGAKIINGEGVAGAPLTLDLEGVPERQALDIILRGVSGYVLAARQSGVAGVSMYDRIMILPTSVAPRNPPPAMAGTAPGIIRPLVPRQADDQNASERWRSARTSSTYSTSDCRRRTRRNARRSSNRTARRGRPGRRATTAAATRRHACQSVWPACRIVDPTGRDRTATAGSAATSSRPGLIACRKLIASSRTIVAA